MHNKCAVPGIKQSDITHITNIQGITTYGTHNHVHYHNMWHLHAGWTKKNIWHHRSGDCVMWSHLCRLALLHWLSYHGTAIHNHSWHRTCGNPWHNASHDIIVYDFTIPTQVKVDTIQFLQAKHGTTHTRKLVTPLRRRHFMWHYGAGWHIKWNQHGGAWNQTHHLSCECQVTSLQDRYGGTLVILQRTLLKSTTLPRQRCQSTNSLPQGELDGEWARNMNQHMWRCDGWAARVCRHTRNKTSSLFGQCHSKVVSHSGIYALY